MSDVRLNINPFPGIRSFESEEDFLFFGRDEQIKGMLDILSDKHFLALIGYSGSGKSSLIKAGIIPSISKGRMNKGKEEWNVFYFRPGDDPFRSFASVLYNVYGTSDIEFEDFIANTVEFLKKEETGFAEVYQKFNVAFDKNWLIFIDQFEELFRFSGLHGERELIEARRFVNLILSVLNKTELPIYVAIAMRSDFLDNCTEFIGFPEALNEALYLLPKFFGSALREAIVKPIEVCGGTITPRLVERLIKDADDKTEHLPVLQHALMRTWDYWKLNKIGQEPLDIVHYEAIGTMSMALSMHAEEIFNSFSASKSKQITETIFKALTDLGVDKKGTRRPVPLKDLLLLMPQASEDEVVDVIDQFRAQDRAFLMPPYHTSITIDSIIDISHESIMRLWLRLKEWVEEETRSAELYMRLSESAKLYHQGKTGLWIDPDLALAIKWKQENNPNARWAVRYDSAFERAITFLDYSKTESQAKIEQKTNRQIHDLRRARRTAIILGTASIISILLLVFALNLKFKAEASEKVALEESKKTKIEGIEADLQKKQALLQQWIAEQQQSIAAQQQNIAEEQRRTAIDAQKNAEAQRIEAVLQRQEAEVQRKLAVYQEKQADTAKLAAIAAGEEAKAQRDQAIIAKQEVERLRLLSEARTIAFLSSQILNDAQSDTLSLQLSFLSYAINKEYGGPAQTRAIYDALKGQINRYYNKVLRYPYGVKVSADGYDIRSTVFLKNNDFFTAGDNGSISEWVVTHNPMAINNKSTSRRILESITAISLSPDKKYLVSRSISGKIYLWDVDHLNAVPTIVNDASIKAEFATFIPAKKGYDILIRAAGFVYLYDNQQSKLKLIARLQICQATSSYYTQAGCTQFTKTGTNVYIANGNEVCTLDFSLNGDLTAINKDIKLKENITSMAVSNSGKFLAIGTNQGGTNLFNLTQEKPLFISEINGHGSQVTGVSFSNDDSTIASGSLDNSIRVVKWENTEKKEEDLIFQDKKNWVRDIAISPNDRYILSVTQSGIIQFWPLTQKIALDELTGIADNRNIIKDHLKEGAIENIIGKDLYKKLWSTKYKSFKEFWSDMTNKYIAN